MRRTTINAPINNDDIEHWPHVTFGFAIRFDHAIDMQPRTTLKLLDGIEEAADNLHDPQGVLKTGVSRSRVDHVGPCKLFDAAQTLKGRLIYDIPFPFIQLDEAVNGVADFICIGHKTLTWHCDKMRRIRWKGNFKETAI